MTRLSPNIKIQIMENMHKNIGYSLPLYLLHFGRLYKGMTEAKQHEDWLTKTCTDDSALSESTNQYLKEDAISA